MGEIEKEIKEDEEKETGKERRGMKGGKREKEIRMERERERVRGK